MLMPVGKDYVFTGNVDQFQVILLPGMLGDIGQTGSGGATGPRGDRGHTGPTGYSGSTGVRGPQGASGSTGSAGSRGSVGGTGHTGFTGMYFIENLKFHVSTFIFLANLGRHNLNTFQFCNTVGHEHFNKDCISYRASSGDSF